LPDGAQTPGKTFSDRAKTLKTCHRPALIGCP
jgi:hypothetical protein